MFSVGQAPRQAALKSCGSAWKVSGADVKCASQACTEQALSLQLILPMPGASLDNPQCFRHRTVRKLGSQHERM